MEFDYQALGLKCGLECHQQLDVGKLFCRCPSVLREETPDLVFRRKIRPVPSELGKYDAAALEAFKKDLTYVYQAYSDTTCLVEADETPPLPVNEKALETVFEVALLTGAKIFDEMYVMRKTVIDGSNVSGFQRTMLAAKDGGLQVGKKKVGISVLILEEDAARLIEKKGREVVYRLDRLGIPLIELATTPDFTTPEEAKAGALRIGELFRITGKAKRGLGSIRQDVNISIREGARVEVKGIQELELIDEYVKREIQRQLALIEIRKELEKRKVKAADLKPEFVPLANELKQSKSSLVQRNFQAGNTVFGLRLKGFGGLLGKEVQPGRRFGTELSGYVKARTPLKGLVHSDELPAYGLDENDIKKIRADLKAREQDAFVLVLGPESLVIDALQVVLERARYAFKGVPLETRGAIGEGNTEYQRILAGAARMYPETDLPTVKLDKSLLKRLEKNLPLWAAERKKLYLEKFGLSEKLADKMKLSNHARDFERLVAKGFNATTAAVLLLEDLVQLKREKVPVENIDLEKIEAVLKAVKEKRLTKDVVKEVLAKWAANPRQSLDEVAAQMDLAAVGSDEARQVIVKIIGKNKAMVKAKQMHAFSALMGEAMRQLKGKTSGQEIAKLLKEELAKVIKGG